MPGIKWYFQRLRAMGPGEIPWRVWRVGRARAGVWRRWPTAAAVESDKVWSGPCTAAALRRRATPFPDGPAAGDLAHWPLNWREGCLYEAGRLLDHRFRFFMLEDQPFGERIDWQCDYASGKRVPLHYAGRLDYRDAGRVGDVKVIWELSRMQHLTRLAQAWRWSGDACFPREIVGQISDWIDRNPWMMGINWTSPMECALRLLSWTWAFHLIRDWEELDDAFCRLLVASVHQHLRTIDSTYSLFSSANNHLIAEASGAYVAASYWSGLKGAARWRRRARTHLLRECPRQNTVDGVNEEHTFPYQVFVWELLVLPALAGRAQGDCFPPEYWSRLERMAEFMAWVTDSAGNTANVGDQDDGKTLNLGGDADKRVASLLALAGRLFRRDDFVGWGGAQFDEKTAWLTGTLSASTGASVPLRGSRSFPDGGYHVLRSIRSGADEVFLLFDVAPNGDAVTGVHGHADALSVLLHLGGEPFLDDPGTFSYQDTPLRHFFRATAQHNTLCFGDDDQSEYLNRFLWGRRAQVALLDATLGATGGVIAGRVDWWTGACHERRVEFEDSMAQARLFDRWRGTHPARLNFTVAPGITVTATGDKECRLVGQRAILDLHWDIGRVELLTMPFSRRCYQQGTTQRILVHLPGEEGAVVTRLSWNWSA